MISPQTISQVEEAANIVDVISEFVSLKKKGVNFTAPCPFHNEKSASFTVSPVKGIYKCFGCGKGGNSITFVMEIEKYSYMEAIRFLAGKYNIQIDEEEKTDEEKAKTLIRESILSLNKLAAEHFQEQLFSNPTALQYILDRGISENTIRKFQIGYAPAGYRLLFEKLQKLGYSKDIIVAADLAYDRDGKMLDKYRDRITFPIHSLSGKIIGFSARILNADSTLPKYVNTAENEVYHKSDALYGLAITKKFIIEQDEAFLVEGNMDVVSLFEKEFLNSLASSGTAFTSSQVKAIKRFTNNITILFDGDLAGRKAAAKAIELCLVENINVKAVIFPANEDPDSYIQNHGRDAFIKYVNANKGDIIDFYHEAWKTISPEHKDRLVATVIHLISIINSDNIHQKEFLATKAGRILGIPLEKINNAIHLYNKDHTVTIKTEDLQPAVTYIHEIEFAKALIMYGHLEFEDHFPCYKYMMERAFLPEEFNEEIPKSIFIAYYNELLEGRVPNEDFFINNEDASISEFASNLFFEDRTISTCWSENGSLEKSGYVEIVKNVMRYLRIHRFKLLIAENQILLANATEENLETILTIDHNLKRRLSIECKSLGINIL